MCYPDQVFLDAVAISFVVMLAVLGWRGGALHSVGKWAALVGAYMAARPLGAATAPELAARAPEWLAKHPGMIPPAATLLAGVVLFFLFSLAASVVVRFLRLAPMVAGADRMLGLVLGTTKGVLLAYTLACFMVMLDKPLRTAFPALSGPMDGSQTVMVAREMNLIADLLEDPGVLPTVDPGLLPGRVEL